jgi:hypothetical protein
MKFRKKPTVIEAVQFVGGNFDVIEQFVGSDAEFRNKELVIATLEGPLRASDGDWIIRGIKGEFYPCKPDIFTLTYETVDEGDAITQAMHDLVNRGVSMVRIAPNDFLAPYSSAPKVVDMGIASGATATVVDGVVTAVTFTQGSGFSEPAAQPAAEAVPLLVCSETIRDAILCGNVLAAGMAHGLASLAKSQPARDAQLASEPAAIFVLRALLAAGHVSQDKVDEAFAIASRTPGVDDSAVPMHEIDELQGEIMRLTELLHAKAENSAAEPVDYDRVVSICDAHGITLPVEHVEAVVEIVRLLGAPAVASRETAALTYPEELTPELREILGLICYQCISFAQCLRADGVEIGRRAEDEQAVVLHWLTRFALKHGADWRTRVQSALNEMKDRCAQRDAGKAGGA